MGENMTDVLLRVENLHVSVGDTPIIQGISLEIKRGEIHAIMGRNGAGKSTLANVVMGHPAYEVTSGTIHYKGQNIEDMEVFERARAGMFLSFQYPAAIPGVQVGTFLRKSVASVRGEAPSPRAFRKELNEAMKQLDMDKSFLSRYVNDGFSGGEKKRLEIPQFVLNKSLINSNLNSFASSPEDSVEIYQNGQDIILQSVDGFPALVSDPWLNAKITTLHACSDLWACGAKLSSAQALISLPKVEREFQSYLFSQSLQGIKSTVEDHGGELLGGHTFEARSLVNKPYSLGIDISLTVQGILKNGAKPWLKSGMNIGDILMMSRPLGVGIYFAGQMQNINMLGSSSEVINNLVKSQQYLIDEIYLFQNQFKESLVNAATDITGYGFIGHLKEMVESSNLYRQSNNLEPLKVLLDLFAFKAYPGVFDLIRKDVKSTFFESNKEIFDKIYKVNKQKRIINFLNENSLDQETFNERISLLLDPQTCGPLLISCNRKYENVLKDKWYKVGEVVKM